MKPFVLFILLLLDFSSCKKQDPPSPPSAAQLISPSQNEICTTGLVISDSISQVQFSWNPSANTDGYVFTIKNLLTNIPSSTNLSNASLSLNLTRNTPYSWYITSTNHSTNATAQSPIWKFYVAGLPSITYPPFPADLISPGFSQIIPASGTVNLIWKGSTAGSSSISGYDLYFGTNPNPPVYQTHISNPYLNGIPIQSGFTYYWKVLSRDGLGNTSISSLSLFSVQ